MRNTAKLLLSAGFLLVAVSACGEKAATGTNPPASGPATATPGAPSSPGAPSGQPPVGTASVLPAPASPTPGGNPPSQALPPGPAVPPAHLDASALPAGYPSAVTMAEGGKVVVVQAEEGGCDKVSAAPGEQTAQHVVVIIKVTKAPHGQMCPMHVRDISLPVTLAAPLGDRTLVLRGA